MPYCGTRRLLLSRTMSSSSSAAAAAAGSTSSASSTSTYPISSLPLPPPTQRLQNLLTHCPSSQPSYLATLKNAPSSQRRSTTFASGHLSHVTPLPIPFPYRLPSKLNDEGERVAAMGVEEWLTEMEPLAAAEAGPVSDEQEGGVKLRLHSAPKRDWPVTLLAISDACATEVLPHLNIGDALELVQKPLPAEGEEEAERNSARDELVGVLGGREVVMDLGDEAGEGGYKPWSLRYGGRQFGSWAGQLGDGRATSLLETLAPGATQSQEIQIKGGGRTPFSRHADGLAVLRSSIREFLGTENASAFPDNSLPTSRSLTLTLLPTLGVLRENGVEPGAIVSRIAPTFLRIGSFEILNPPANEYSFMMGMGGGYQPIKKPEPEWDLLRDLVGVVQGKLWGWEQVGERGVWEMIREVGRRNAEMVAGWQAQGYMHGVINTDNVSVLGLTIDWGPYAYMDIYDPLHICNHSDDSGRYRFDAQPEMVYFAINALLQSLSELVGYELAHGGAAAPKGWAEGASKEKPKEWRAKGMEKEAELKREFMEVTARKYRQLMGNRFGLSDPTSEDITTIVQPFLDLLKNLELDFHTSFRLLATSPLTASTLSGLTSALLASQPSCSPSAQSDLTAWLTRYVSRLSSQPGGIEASSATRKAWNPRFVLRQWVLEEVIKQVENREEGCREKLNKVLRMSLAPFEPYGAEGEEDVEGLSEEEREERRLCGLGEERMLGFQCSCSS